MAPERASVDVTGKSVTNTDTADAETPVALATPAVNAARLKVPGSMERVSAAATVVTGAGAGGGGLGGLRPLGGSKGDGGLGLGGDGPGGGLGLGGGRGLGGVGDGGG